MIRCDENLAFGEKRRRVWAGRNAIERPSDSYSTEHFSKSIQMSTRLRSLPFTYSKMNSTRRRLNEILGLLQHDGLFEFQSVSSASRQEFSPYDLRPPWPSPIF